jgi:transposase-like protein
VLVELGLVEQRYRAVSEVLVDGVTVTEVALRLGVSRQTVHAWLRRYGNGGIGDLANRSSRPHCCPHQTPAELEAAIVMMRKAHPAWGPRRILVELVRAQVDPIPARSTIYRIFVRNGLIDPQRRRRRREDYRRWERSRAMELWQMDVMGRVRLTDGTELSVVTGIDDHSRFCVSAMVVRKATAKPVCAALAQAMRTSRAWRGSRAMAPRASASAYRWKPDPSEPPARRSGRSRSDPKARTRRGSHGRPPA